MARFDIESFFDNLLVYLKANLNTKISAISTEKADSVTLGSVSDSAYIFMTLDESVANYDPFVFYTISGVNSEGIGYDTQMEYLCEVAIIMSHPGADPDGVSRTLRYHRALQEVLQEYYAENPREVNLKVSSLEPVTFASQHDSRLFRAVGVQISVTFA